MTDDLTDERQHPAGSTPPGLLLRPFRGVRFAARDASSLGALTSPPYDLVDRAGVDRLMARDPHNVVRLILPRDGNAGGRYAHAATTLASWLRRGVLVVDPEPALYVYEARWAGGLQRGLIGSLELVGDDTGAVLPHEDVMPGPVADRLQLMRATAANLDPIFLLYRGGGAASRVVENIARARTPASTAVTEGTTHTLWRIVDPAEQREVAADLAKRAALIADGHHRYATYLRLQKERHDAGDGDGPWDYGLALLVDETAYPPSLGAIHRVLPGIRPREAREKASKAFRVTRTSEDLGGALDELAVAAADGPAFLLAGDGQHHLLDEPNPRTVETTVPREHSALWRRLPTSVLQHLLIERLWGITEDERSVLAMYHDPGAAVRSAAESAGTAVLLHPPRVGDVRRLAEQGERVPRKSTSFGPKPPTGLVLRTFETG
ncbi:MAG: DUF1015 family protein [Streptosporangiaceae bacterium]